MASSPLVLPGVLFVGEDERQRLTAHTGPAAGWMSPKGILQWSSEVSVVVREAMTEDVRRETKAVMPEEQIPPAKYPLTLEAAKRSPLVAVSSRLTSKLVEQNVRVHTIGVDRMTSSFFYIAEGGGEESITVSGDLVQAVAEMLGERADNAAIERVLDSLVDRLLRSLSKDRVTELGVELAAALPRAASDGTGAQGVDLDTFEKDLAALVGASEKYAPQLQDIADKIAGTTERKVDVPLYGDARKVPQGPFDLTVGDRKIALGTYERWVMTGPFAEPSAAKPAAAGAATPAAKPVPSPKPAETKPAPSPKPAATTPIATTSPTPAPAKAAALAAPIAPRAASDRPPPPRPISKSRPESTEIEAAPAAAAAKVAEPPKVEEKKAEEPKPEPAKVEEPKVVEAKAEPKPEEPKKAEEPKAEAKAEEPKAKEKAKAKAAKDEEADESSRELEKTSEKAVEKKKPEEAAKKGGFPWLAVIIAIAVAIVVYQVFLSKK